MAHLVVIGHEFDWLAGRPEWYSGGIRSPYMLFDILRELEGLGHSWKFARGLKTVPGDAALFHVDATVIPPEYLDLAHNYKLALNAAVTDISKRKISTLILDRTSDWDGPVIVKANLNNKALPEWRHNVRAGRFGQPIPHPGVERGGEYEVFDRIRDVDEAVWADPHRVVERFVPERDPNGNYVIRTWVFMGPNERCTRFVTPHQVSRAGGVIHHEPMQVPDALREERRRLGFDYGKFDFVMHEGRPVLLDANKTPGVSRTITTFMKDGARNLAEGLDKLLRGEA